jgi:shikimate dehydrogenase
VTEQPSGTSAVDEPGGGRLRLGVIGDPVAHSLSPALHQPALDALAIPARFERWHTVAADLPARIASLREPDALGASVTVPHKIATLHLVDEVAPSARAVGAVNTVVNRGGRLVGENTDVHGFATSLTGACPDAAGRTALVLGAGGAARAVVVALHGLGVGPILVAAREPAKAAALGAAVGVRVQPVGYSEADLGAAATGAGILVNATSLGWRAGELPVPEAVLDRLPPAAVIADLTYRDTDLLLAARRRGLSALDGLGMLIHQGARAFALWTGRPAPLAAMSAAAEAARRGG